MFNNGTHNSIKLIEEPNEYKFILTGLEYRIFIYNDNVSNNLLIVNNVKKGKIA